MYRLSILARLLRTNQWMKNSVLFVAIIFSGKLMGKHFEPLILLSTTLACFIFCLLSSGLYIINDILDAPADRRHPQKKLRPIASREISVRFSAMLSFLLLVSALSLATTISMTFVFFCLVFISLHIAYSAILKSYAVIDIFAISFSFMIRAYAGEVASKFHIPAWLMLTIFFLSLFIASIKRNAEFVLMGPESRGTLAKYNKHFLDFLTYTFATATIIAYCLYSNIEPTVQADAALRGISNYLFSPGIENKKLMALTIPVVVYAIARYGQLFYTRIEGERPEKLIVTDVPLAGTMIVWATMTITILYFL